ncbi:MAG: hypothetical protein HY735_32400 [Verrucomicrobia bacterium]|nr:hypothetical protein [Verrucomicrobiota bacterium]
MSKSAIKSKKRPVDLNSTAVHPGNLPLGEGEIDILPPRRGVIAPRFVRRLRVRTLGFRSSPHYPSRGLDSKPSCDMELAETNA